MFKHAMYTLLNFTYTILERSENSMEHFTLVYENEVEDIIDSVNSLKEYFKKKEIEVGIWESIHERTHFLKIYFAKEKFNEKYFQIFNLYIANILYREVVKEFFKKNLVDFLSENYFFLTDEEIIEIKNKSVEIFNNETFLIDDKNIFYLNRKNEMIDKIIDCVKENNEININGFVMFRMKELEIYLEGILEKIVEDHMVEKEYDEFIKLLQYFVNIQESRIDELNIIIDIEGRYILRDKDGNDITESFMADIHKSKISTEVLNGVNFEDMLISNLITYCPEKIVIHCSENSFNQEIISTISKVFLQKVEFCSECKMCNKIKRKSPL